MMGHMYSATDVWFNATIAHPNGKRIVINLTSYYNIKTQVII